MSECSICVSLRSILDRAILDGDAVKVRTFTKLLAQHESEVHGGQALSRFEPVTGAAAQLWPNARVGK